MQCNLQPHAAIPSEGYAGEATPQQTWSALSTLANAVLVDVRTQAEWDAGTPDLTGLGKSAVTLSWKLLPDYRLNADFSSSFKKLGISQDTPIFFLCRAGGRSLEAARAMTAEGYTACYNITGGYEGGLPDGQRAHLPAGWKASGLPCTKGAAA